MRIDIITLFPQMFSGPFDESIIKRAREKNLVEINIHNLRSWAVDKRGTVDDRPFGGGPGMILRPEPIFAAVEEIKNHSPTINFRRKNLNQFPKEKAQSIILLTPQGQVFKQEKAQKLAKLKHLILICGHYEGVDERVRERLADEEISIGDYILTGGEIPAMVVVDTITRLIPGVLGKGEATQTESFSPSTPILEYPQYTRPEVFRGWRVPKILLSGNHQKIAAWRKQKSLERTTARRPDLLRDNQGVVSGS